MVFLNHGQNLHIHAVRANILMSFSVDFRSEPNMAGGCQCEARAPATAGVVDTCASHVLIHHAGIEGSLLDPADLPVPNS